MHSPNLCNNKMFKNHKHVNIRKSKLLQAIRLKCIKNESISQLCRRYYQAISFDGEDI